MSKVKIVVISSYPSQGCGVSKYTGELIAGLRREQTEVCAHRIFFYREKIKNVLWLKIFCEVLKVKPDIVHIQYTPTICGPIMPAFLLLLRLFGLEARVILTSHEKPSVYLRHFPKIVGRLFLLYEKWIFIHTDRVLVHTLEHKQELMEKYDLREEGIEVIPHGVGTAERASISRVRGIENKYCLKGKEVITSFGAIRPNKGFEYLIRSFSRALEKKDDLILLIAGSAPKTWARYLAELKVLVQSLEIEDAVRFTGFVDEDDVPAIMSISKAIVMPYMDITQSGVLYREAIAYSKPLVVTDVGDLGKTVERYQIGLVVPPKDIDSLGEAILDLIKDETRLELCQNNATKLKHEFSWDVISRLHISIYRGLERTSHQCSS